MAKVGKPKITSTKKKDKDYTRVTFTPDYERFKKYPEVMMIDCTHDTNDEKRELCMATGKDRNNNVFPISRCALPNGRMMIFHWKFSTFFKVHLPKKIRDRV